MLALAIVLLIFGILSLTALLIYTEFGRDVSIKFSALMVIIAAFCLGFSIQAFLVTNFM